jgi:hypothetical protein
MPYFQRKNPLVFPVSPGGTKKLRYPTGCDSSDVSGGPVPATAHTPGAMSLHPYYIPSGVSSIDIVVQTLATAGQTRGTVHVGIYDANQGLENSYLTESTSFVCSSSTTTGETTVFSLTKNYSEGWYIVSGVQSTGGSSLHTSAYVSQVHVLGRTLATSGVGNPGMGYLSASAVYLNNQTSGLPQTIGSAISTGTLVFSSTVPAPMPYLQY